MLRPPRPQICPTAHAAGLGGVSLSLIARHERPGALRTRKGPHSGGPAQADRQRPSGQGLHETIRPRRPMGFCLITPKLFGSVLLGKDFRRPI